MKAVLVLNGEPPALSRLRSLASRYPVYAADGGAQVCLQAGIRPEWVVGDFDSQGKKDLPGEWELCEYPEQDRTDFEKLLSTLPDEICELQVLGGLGRRLDHLITNLLIVCQLPEDLKVIFEAEGQGLYRVTPGCRFDQSVKTGTTLSLLPLQEVAGVSTSGLKWNLENQRMGPGLQLGQSNEVVGEVTIRIGSGNVFVWVEECCGLF